MSNKKFFVSIIIVHYKAKKELFNCIESIIKSKPKIPFEIIVVDNDEQKYIGKEIKTKFPMVKYIKSDKNRGFGAGNNLGARYAKGRFLFFLNPDTIVNHSTIDNLVQFISKDKEVGIVAPLLLDKERKPYEKQGTQKLTPAKALFALSFIDKIFPKNPFSRHFWLQYWDKKSPIETAVVPGSAFLIRREIFQRIGSFDERFFLYFEENDLCKRIQDLGYKIYIEPHAKIIHLWGKSTQGTKNIKEIFERSRFLYFRKHFGLLQALFTEAFLRLSKFSIILFFILLLSLFLRFYKLPSLMMFIGDQGWFYLSARDMLLTGNIPLVGITSSHTWLHQGPLWTYMLAGALFISNFNPVSGAILTSLIGLVTIFLIYRIGNDFFSKELGLIAALLYATSPLVVIHARMAYHTSPIPFFASLLIYSLIKTIKGSAGWFPIVFLSLSLLYNFELATVVFIPVVIFILGVGIYKKEKWVSQIQNRRIILLSILGLLIPMVPILIYDFGHGFPQTLKFGAWIFYKGLQSIGFTGKPIAEPFLDVLGFFINKIFLLIYAPSVAISILILFLTIVYSLVVLIKRRIYPFSSISIIFLFTIVALLGFFIAGAKSEAYLPMLFPGIVLLISFALYSMFRKNKYAILIIIAISFTNAIFIIKNDYLMDRLSGYGPGLAERIEAVREIIRQTKGQKYNLKGRGEGSEFESFIMNYEYLIWWMGGKEPSDSKAEFQIIVTEGNGNVKITKLSNQSL